MKYTGFVRASTKEMKTALHCVLQTCPRQFSWFSSGRVNTEEEKGKEVKLSPLAVAPWGIL